MGSQFRSIGRLAAGAVASTVLLAGCGGGLGSEAESVDGPVKIGLLVPQSGVYKALGDDMKNGWELYLEQNDGKLGGREVETVLADEGEEASTGQAAAERLVMRENALAVTGVVSSATMNGVADMFESNQVPLVGSNASPTTLTDVEYVWRTSYVNDEPGKALGKYVAENVDGSVYLLAADYQAGIDEIEGFKETFQPAGGEIADEVYTPFPTTTNYQPFMAKVKQSDAKAAFTFYAGGAAVDFVKQYKSFGLNNTVDLYSAGFLTEGGVLDAQGRGRRGHVHRHELQPRPRQRGQPGLRHRVRGGVR